MILSDLLADVEKYGASAEGFKLHLATRTVDGQKLEPSRVQLSEAGTLQIDESGEDVDVLPTRFMKSDCACLTIANVRSQIAEQPRLADFAINGVYGFKRLADGGNVQITDPIVGTFTPNEGGEIWLLHAPEDQWPASWFAT